MPGAFPHTSTYALTNATLAHALEVANLGWREAALENPALTKGVNVAHGQIVHRGVADAHGVPYVDLANVSG